jgi:hypothetical protein
VGVVRFILVLSALKTETSSLELMELDESWSRAATRWRDRRRKFRCNPSQPLDLKPMAQIAFDTGQIIRG